MIVDYIDSQQDTNFEEMKLAYKKGGKSKQYPISAWVPMKPGPYVKLRHHIPLPDCKLDDVLPFLLKVE